ncbi:efflux RND transporter periplasmic adaptor subunit [Sphingobacterium corticibacter]|uniref:Efflux transporter periplasmic adaptor subunit n=1 Tax=Sphingobacterium corticibacter TaxID=2171749 RepID=A0A2T8HGB1_9SPHI|nr:efflux RND transporter periplasmic adaptor subunit [Sphingobacterium corticibacter]PVH24465.1 efflux transporter periplasmic adaptor subunit [Sphingobacterium corticibacter]
MLIKKNNWFQPQWIIVLCSAIFLLDSCSHSESKEKEKGEKALALPVHVVKRSDAVTVKTYLGTIEGKVNVEVRPQVEGLLQEIYVDEGAYVQKGQKLFKVDQSAYQESLNNMLATAEVAKAQLKNAQLEIDRLKPLVSNDVISDVRLSAAQSDYEVAQATLQQAQAAVRSAEINKDFTLITAPVSGYIGRIPKRIGNLVTKGDKEPLTFLSDIQEVYVYFAMNESDFLYFSKAQAKKDSIAGREYNRNNKLTFPKVTLVLADGEEYPIKGVVDAVNGQVDRSTGAISLRATFANQDNILRSGSSGTLKIAEVKEAVLQIPQLATNELQDRTFVYVANSSNQVQRRNVVVSGKSKDNYIISEGIEEGDRVVLSGFDKLTDGSTIIPIQK